MAKRFVKEVIAEGIPLKKAILFGSYSKNQQRAHSDYDILLVADSFQGVGFVDSPHFMKVLIKSEYSLVQTKTYSTADYLENDPFVEEINATGIVLFDNLTEQKQVAAAASFS